MKKMVSIILVVMILILIGIFIYFSKTNKSSKENLIIEKARHITDENLILENLIIKSGSLILENSKLEMKGDIEILEGELKIINSTITGKGYSIYYYKGSKGSVINSVIEYTERGKDLLNSSGHGGVAGLNIFTDNFVLKNNIIRNSNGRGVLFGEVKNITASNNIFHNNFYDGIRFYNCSDILAINNTGYENGEYAIKAMYSKNIRIAENIARNNGKDGIQLHTCKDTLIERNKIFDNGKNGIQVGPGLFSEYKTGCSNITVRSNIIKRNKAMGIVFLSSPDSEIYNNTVEKSGENGIIAQWKNDNTNIFKNSVIANNRSGIVILQANNVKVYNNEIKDNGGTGIVFESSQNSKSHDNVISNNGFNGKMAGIFLTNSTTISQNDYIENTTACGIDMRNSEITIISATIKKSYEFDVQAWQNSKATVKNCNCDNKKFNKDENSEIIS